MIGEETPSLRRSRKTKQKVNYQSRITLTLHNLQQQQIGKPSKNGPNSGIIIHSVSADTSADKSSDMSEDRFWKL